MNNDYKKVVRRDVETQSSQRNLAKRERTLSLIGGAALIFNALRNPFSAQVLWALPGLWLAGRGYFGYDPLYNRLGVSSQAADQSSHTAIERSITIGRPLSEVYTFWRDFAGVAQVLKNLESATLINATDQHWQLSVNLPVPGYSEWHIAITQEKVNALFAWESLPDSKVETRGSVRFKELTHNRGTEVKILFAYRPAMGLAGEALANFSERLMGQQLRDEMNCVKHMLEAGELPTTEGQPSGPKATDVLSSLFRN